MSFLWGGNWKLIFLSLVVSLENDTSLLQKHTGVHEVALK
jgi:hypothetical protein